MLHKVGKMLKRITETILNNENLLAIVLTIIIILLIILSADTSPNWIYQGF